MATNLLQAAQEDERRKAAALGQPRPNSFGDAAAVARDPSTTQVAAAPTALGQMHNPNPRSGVQMLASGLDSGARAFFDSFGPTQEKPAPAAPTPNPTDIRLAAGTQSAPMSATPAAQTLAKAAASTPAPTQTSPAIPAPADNQMAPGVFRHGRGQYSDNAGGMGLSSSFTGQPNAQNMQAAESLARGFRPGMDAAATSQGPGLGFSPSGVTAPTVLHSGNSWQARNDLRNLAVSASSITNRPEWQSGSATSITGSTRGKTGKDDPHGNIAAYQTALGADIAARGAQPGFDMQAARENAATMREGMQQSGATTRTGMTEQGANARESGRSILARDEFNLRKEASGFQTRAAQQQEQLRNVLLDQKATPEQRAVAQRNLAALSGKTAADRMQTVALPDTTNEMGQVVRGGQALVRVLEDGSVQQVPIGAQQDAATPPGMTKQVGTSNGRPVYEDAKGNRFVG